MCRKRSNQSQSSRNASAVNRRPKGIQLQGISTRSIRYTLQCNCCGFQFYMTQKHKKIKKHKNACICILQHQNGAMPFIAHMLSHASSMGHSFSWFPVEASCHPPATSSTSAYVMDSAWSCSTLSTSVYTSGRTWFGGNLASAHPAGPMTKMMLHKMMSQLF